MISLTVICVAASKHRHTRLTGLDEGTEDTSYSCRSVETLTAPAIALKPRSEALSLVSSCDSGYDSEDWEYVDTEDEEEDGEEWEYFFESSPLEIPRKELQNSYCKTPIQWNRTAQTESISRTLKNWIKIMKDPNSEILLSLEEEFKASSFSGETQIANDKASLKPSVKQYVGKKDKQGRFHGEGEVRYMNGSILWASFKHGVAEGRGVLEHLNGDKFEVKLQTNLREDFKMTEKAPTRALSTR